MIRARVGSVNVKSIREGGFSNVADLFPLETDCSSNFGSIAMCKNNTSTLDDQ